MHIYILFHKTKVCVTQGQYSEIQLSEIILGKDDRPKTLFGVLNKLSKQKKLIILKLNQNYLDQCPKSNNSPKFFASLFYSFFSSIT